MDSDNIVKDGSGQPVVPFGTQAPMSEVPKDIIRPTPQPMPAKNPEVIRETVQQKAVEGTITFADLAAKKGFGSPDDLAKAYANLESQNKRVEVTLADAIKARQEPQAPLPPVEEVDDTETALRIVDSRVSKQVNAVKDAFEYKLHLIENPGDKQYASDAIKYVRENPGISWDLAFKAAKADNLTQVASTAKEEGTKEAYQNIQKKEGGQTVQGGSQREPQADVKDLIESIKTGRIPLSEAKQLINRISQ